jgi:DNA-binding response OmpR family regulator
LAIDDEPCLLRLFPRALRNHDVVALGPDDALRLLEEDRAFDLVLCDLNLPRANGRWFHDRLLELAAELADRILFCTGGGCSSEGWQILEASPERVVYKPFDGRQLRAAVERFAQRSDPRTPA